MTVEQLQEGYYYFLREAYGLRGIMRRHRGAAYHLPSAIRHFGRNYLLSRYGMIKTAHALKRRPGRTAVARAPVSVPATAKPAAASARLSAVPEPGP
jgi:hypothetical protein